MVLPTLGEAPTPLEVRGDAEAGFLFCLHPVLTVPECQSIVRWAEARGFDAAPVNGATGPVQRPEVRNNARVMVDDHGFAVALWARIGPAFEGEGPFGARAVGLNERVRLYRYDAGMYFKPHTDGAYMRPDGSQRSLQTVMVYLNEGFEGGETRFYEASTSITPQTGLACVFWHRQLHEGCTVRGGRKYALRTDVMYG